MRAYIRSIQYELAWLRKDFRITIGSTVCHSNRLARVDGPTVHRQWAMCWIDCAGEAAVWHVEPDELFHRRRYQGRIGSELCLKSLVGR